MTEHFHAVGPPGTGKTTFLQKQIAKWADEFGIRAVMACSLTRAAAAEIKGRDLAIPGEQVGTLHSFAYHAIGNPTLAEEKLGEWATAYPHYALSKGKHVNSPENDRPDEAGDGNGLGDESYERMNILRHSLIPVERWPVWIATFHRKWQEWVKDSGYIDFTGMIERALNETWCAPYQPKAMVIDEAQDMSRLEIALLSSWSASIEKMAAVGDPAQAMYVFRGAEPYAFSDVGGPGHQRVLKQSYRVPRAVHAAAVRWAGDLLTGIEYLPRPADGSVSMLGFNRRQIGELAELVEEHLAEPDPGTLMVQFACNYMLPPLVTALRERGIPFHNPMRLKEGSWNPLADKFGKGKKKLTSTKDRLLAFVHPEPTPERVAMWLPLLQTKGVLVHGTKERIKDGLPSDPSEILALFASEAVANHAFSGDVEWLRDNAVGTYRDTLNYPLRVLAKYGADGLENTPQVAVGTNHSFKGGEASRVVLCPDLSSAGFREHSDGGLGVRRAMYVGMTRARDRLEILQRSDANSVELL
jgi:hypothetical protein